MIEIDLHNTSTITDALEQLERELFLVYRAKQSECRVIHGIGEGVLALAVHQALTRSPLVRHWQEDDIGGSCLVSL